MFPSAIRLLKKWAAANYSGAATHMSGPNPGVQADHTTAIGNGSLKCQRKLLREILPLKTRGIRPAANLAGKEFMAKKVMLMRFLQEIRGYAEVTNRRPVPPPPAIFLMQLREYHVNALLSNRPEPVAITAAWQNGADVALPVRINHLNPG